MIVETKPNDKDLQF